MKIVQDSEAVDKIADAIKKKQESAEKDPGSAMVSTTTKKVATGTLNLDEYDISQVVLDFVDELQTSILQIRLNLNREYEYKKFQ